MSEIKIDINPLNDAIAAAATEPYKAFIADLRSQDRVSDDEVQKLRRQAAGRKPIVMLKHTDEKGPYYDTRIRYAKRYLGIGVVALVVPPLLVTFVAGIFAQVPPLLPDAMFYADPHDGIEDLWRFVWMVPWLFLGLAWRGWELRNHPDPPRLAYIVAYPIAVMATGLFAFAILHGLVPALTSWLYYFVTPAIGLLIGVLAIPGILMRLKMG